MAKVACGKTPPGSGWHSHKGTYTPRLNYTASPAASTSEVEGIYIDVDTSSFDFSEIPHYAISLSGTSYKWATTGGDAVYNPTKDGFRVYIRRSDGAPLTAKDAEGCGLCIHWLALEGGSVTLDGDEPPVTGP